MAEIFIPIDATNVRSVIPSGDEILYSTLGSMDAPDKSRIVTYWRSHVLVTANGIAYTVPMPDKTLKNCYQTWVDVPSMEIKAKRLYIINLGAYEFFLTSDEKVESRGQLSAREQAFFQRFLPILIQRKREWLAATEKNAQPDKKKTKEIEKQLKDAEKLLSKIA